MNTSLRDDWFLLPFELRLQRASAKALTAASVLSADESASLRGALEALEQQFLGAPCPDSPAEDLHTWIEAKLTEAAGEAGRKIHTARSRNDQVATLLRMFVIDAGERFGAKLGELVALLARRAKEWADLPMPMMTHTQFAAPGSAGFWALRYAVALDRLAASAAFQVSQWRQRCPLGAGAVAGSSIAIDRAILARELGFEQPSLNALYDTSTRDECVEWLALAAQTALHFQSFAADLILFSQSPLRWTRYPPAFATGSSMMPNKLNPDAMELLRGEAAALPAAHHHALLLLKGLPSGYNRDLQCIKPIVRDATGKAFFLCELLHAFVEGMDFDASRLAASMNVGDIFATLRMEQLVRDGVPLREAHHAVATQVRNGTGQSPGNSSQPSDGSTSCFKTPSPFQGEGRGEGESFHLNHFSPSPNLSPKGERSFETSSKQFDPLAAIQSYQTIGSAAPAETRRVAEEMLRRRSADSASG